MQRIKRLKNTEQNSTTDPPAAVLPSYPGAMKTNCKATLSTACSYSNHLRECRTPLPQLLSSHTCRQDPALGLATPKSLAEQIEFPQHIFTQGKGIFSNKKYVKEDIIILHKNIKIMNSIKQLNIWILVSKYLANNRA